MTPESRLVYGSVTVVRRRLLWFLVPFAIVFGAIALVRSDRPMADNDLARAEPGTPRTGRVVFVMVDSLSASLAEDAAQFPALASLRPRALWGRIAGCLPASTVACTRTMLEGSNAGYVASLDNFAARRAGRESFPLIAHGSGLRVATASDHTFTHMLGDLGGPRIEYAAAGVPVFGWDEAAQARVAEWIEKNSADVLLVHLVDLDKASHSPGPKSARYAREIRDVDAVLADIAARLRPGDSLVVAGDHGHDEVGNHTPDPGYLALGPAFAPGRVDIEQATVALLLSAAANTPLPPAYDGEVPAGALTAPYGASREREAVIRRAVSKGRAARRALLRSQTLEFLPGLALAALGLGALLPIQRFRKASAGLLLLTTCISVAVGFGWASVFRAAFWLGPASNLLNYFALLALVAVPVALFTRRKLATSWAQAVAAALLAFPLLVHLTGDDYFAPARFLTRIFPLAVLLLSFEHLKRRDRGAALAVAASLATTLLVELHSSALDGFLPSSLLGITAGALLYWAAPHLSPLRRSALAAIPVLLTIAMRHSGWATLALVLLSLSVAAVVSQRSLPAPLRGLVAAAAAVSAFWLSLGSLRFDRVRFEFALSWLPTVPDEALLAVLVTPLAVLKYALIVYLPLALVRFAGESEFVESLAFFSTTPSLSATAFVAGASFAGGSRYHETAIQEASLYAVIALLTLALLAIIGARRKQPGRAERGGAQVALSIASEEP